MERDDAFTEMYREQLREDSQKIVRNSRHPEFWEAAVEEMRIKYQYLLSAGKNQFIVDELDLVSLIHEYDRL